MNIIIPMAGRGKRFLDQGYELPKPLIKIHNKSLIECVTSNVRPQQEHRFIYVCLEEHLRKYDLETMLRTMSPECVIVSVSQVTEGAACTVLLAQAYIDNEEPLMIANSDQFINAKIDDYLASMGDYDGYIMTMRADHPKWSYIRVGAEGLVSEVREKEVISDYATVGIYNFKHGRDFVKYAKQMINKDIRVNGEFYVAPVYNEMISDNMRVSYYNIGDVETGMYGLGTPEDLSLFQKLDISEVY